MRSRTRMAITRARATLVCEALGMPFWCGELDAPAAGDATNPPAMPSHPFAKFMVWALAGPGHPVDRRLHEGDELAGFTVLDTPGHSAGHISLGASRIAR